MKRGHIPIRQCIACRTRRPKAELIRLEARGDRVKISGAGEPARGRGCYLCPTQRCIKTALKKGAFSRALRGNFVPPSEGELMGRLETKGLLNGAVDR